MDKRALKSIGMATMAGVPDSVIERDPARYFHVALAAMRAAYQAAHPKDTTHDHS